MSTTAIKRIEPEILNILAGSRVDGTQLFLPPTRLDPKTYKRVNVVLESIGGKWNRKAQAHVFENPAADVVEEVVLSGEYTNRKTLFQFFQTPVELAQRLVEMAEIPEESAIVLEPSAGAGRILREIQLQSDYCELEPANRAALKRDFAGDKCVGENFLEYRPGPIYDRIVANPPFTRQQDIVHVTHMLECLKPGGIVVSVMSSSITFRDDARTLAFRQLLISHDDTIEELPDGTFSESGTMVNACVVKIRKSA